MWNIKLFKFIYMCANWLLKNSIVIRWESPGPEDEYETLVIEKSGWRVNNLVPKNTGKTLLDFSSYDELSILLQWKKKYAKFLGLLHFFSNSTLIKKFIFIIF